MTQQSETTRQKISFILGQVGMSDEELYQLLYGKKQQVEIDISLPQLMDEEIWQATEHSVEELSAIEDKISTVESLMGATLDPAALAQLEALLEGEIITDDARGLLLKKRFSNWRKGIALFLGFLQFSSLVKLAMAMAATTANHLLPSFENAKNRPQDRRMLSDFILQQLEQPSPPMLGALLSVGAVLTHTGALEFVQPITAAIIGADGAKLLKVKHILEERIDPANHFMDGVADEPLYKDKHGAPQQNKKTTAQLAKLFLLDRIGDLVANQQALQPQQQIEAAPLPQQRPRGNSTRRAQRESQVRQQEQEAQAKLMNNDSPQQSDTPHPHPHGAHRFTSKIHPSRQEPVTPVVRQNTPPELAAAQPSQRRNPPPNTPTIPEKTKAPSPPPASAPAPTAIDVVIKPAAPRALQEAPKTQEYKMAELFANMPLDALKGLKMEHVENKELGKTKSSLPKDNSLPPAGLNKPEAKLER